MQSAIPGAKLDVSGLSPSEQFLYTTVRITTFSGAVPIQHGTGFFWRTWVGERYILSLVTNKHVLEGATALEIPVRMRTTGSSGLPDGVQNVRIELGAGGRCDHPDSAVDLSAISITFLASMPEMAGRSLYLIALSANNIPNEMQWREFDAIEDVLMLGCPNGLYDEVNGLPIFRRGVTASHISYNHKGRDEFLIDAACFPGSSGSPVFLYSTGANFDRETRGFSLGNIRAFFVGILYAGPTINHRGEIVLSAPPSVLTATTMHLGYVIRSTQMTQMDAQILALASRDTA
jgi:hypothetical protein